MTVSYIDFPFAVGPGGRTASTDYAEHVRDLIEQLLFTTPGERVNRPDFGCGLADLVFEPNSPELASVLQVSIAAAIQRWLGDLVTVEDVSVAAQESTLTVAVSYVLVVTGESVTSTLTSGRPR
ncbi:GPW/gp25 family protein [Jatrophihabitans telluris]|uniref:GPW/gp25 family protein n=1 Tax=Jatrophihabitans telluris TaxID=2038343 RepID=A0ABY4QYN2_9ACTN|nr:GPW/gp25 family protein [Jatrophihabitans telluris]UQX88116.1 GPW/gp25 family protein [Jatrophihabitans telluris]